MSRDRQTDRHRDMLTAILCTPTRGDVVRRFSKSYTPKYGKHRALENLDKFKNHAFDTIKLKRFPKCCHFI